MKGLDAETELLHKAWFAVYTRFSAPELLQFEGKGGREMLKLPVTGNTASEIAETLFIAVTTVVTPSPEY